MKRLLLSSLAVTLLLLSACSNPTQPPPTPPPAPTAAPQPVKVEPTAAPQPVKLEPTAAPSASPTPLSPTPLPTATYTSIPTSTPTTAPTNTSTPTATPAPTSTPAPGASVKAATLNVRSGPGSNYDIVATLAQGESLAVAGQTGNCGWLKVTTAKGQPGWVIGGPEYVSLNVSCASVPAVQPPPSPTAAPPTATRPAAPTARPATSAPTGSNLPSDKGCFLFISYVGDELDVTLTRQGEGQPVNLFFKLPPMGQHLECMDPGKYTYTINHARWNGGGDFIVEAGKHFRFPIAGR